MTNIVNTSNEDIAPCKEASFPLNKTAEPGEGDSFPEVSPAPLVVESNVGAHKAEADLAVGSIRLKALTPFVLSRLGRKYEVWDNKNGCLVTKDDHLPLRPHVKELARRLACGTDRIYAWVDFMCQKGPENVVVGELLKATSTGGKGTSRLSSTEEKELQKAVNQVCVVDGLKPASKAANNAICDRIVSAGCVSRKISTATIRARSLSPEITIARTDAYQRDHLMRIAGSPDEVTGLNSVVVMDTTTFTDEDGELRAVDAQGRDLGPVNVIFALLKSNRGIWSVRGFAGPVNSYLAGLTIKRGLVEKGPLLARHKIPGIWAHHGKPGTFNHDCGSEFLNGHVGGALKSRDIGIDDRSAPYTPHHRGDLERFNRTAHALFVEFLESDVGRRYLRSVNGRPKAKGILLSDLDRALIEWVVGHYHVRPHAGLGGDSPLSRMEKFVLGENGLPASGLPAPVADTEELRWDFMWEEHRVVNQLGIEYANRRYVNSDFSRLFKLNSRSSGQRIPFRFNPYAMGSIFVKVPGDDGREEIVRAKWLPETQKYRPKAADQEASINPSLWEWEVLFKDIKRGNTEPPSALLAEALHNKREAESAAGGSVAGAPSKKDRTRDARNRTMREEYGSEDNLTDSVESSEETGSDTVSELPPPPARGRKKDPVPTLLTIGGGSDAY